MGYSNEIRSNKIKFTAEVLVAGSTGEIDLEGATLVGVLLEGDITSTSFTVTVSRDTAGTFVTVKDPEAAGVNKTFTVGSTATGYFPVSPLITAGFRYCKVVFDQSETPTVYIARRSLQ